MLYYYIINMNLGRSRRPTQKAAESSINFDNILNPSKNVTETCDINEINALLSTLSIDIKKKMNDSNLLEQLESSMRSLDITGGDKRKRDDDAEYPNRIKKPKVDPEVEGAALIIANMAKNMTDMKPQLTDPNNQQVIPYKHSETISAIASYAINFINRTSSTITDCTQLILSDTVKNSFIDYTIGLSAVEDFTNPAIVFNRIYNIVTTLTPYATQVAGTAVVISMGVILKKVFAHYSVQSATALTDMLNSAETTYIDIQNMTPEETVDWLKKHYNSLSKTASDISTPLPKDTLKSMMVDIKQNLETAEEPRIGELPTKSAPQQRAGKKSNKTHTKNKKTKARKTKKNKQSLKKKAHKKK